jgi:hypothetical protein
MRSQVAERSLRRLVLKLSKATDDDVELVLESLEPSHRLEVSRLLAAIRLPDPLTSPLPPAAPPDLTPVAAPPRDPEQFAGFSPWLGTRLAVAEDPAGTSPFRMTTAVLATIGPIAQALPPSATSEDRPPGVTSTRTNLLHRWTGARRRSWWV